MGNRRRERVAELPFRAFLFIPCVVFLKLLAKIGFDLVNVQIPLKVMDPSIADRIQWLHGNLYAFRYLSKNLQ
jgi:hypothetical protein